MFTSKKEKLFQAAAKGDIAAIDKAIRAGADVNARHHDGWTALHYASSNIYAGGSNTINALVRHGADVNAKANGGYTALHSAASNDNTDAIEALIRHGADVNAKANDGKTPKMLAKPSAYKVLEAFPNQLLFEAAEKGDVAGIDRAIRAGANVRIGYSVGAFKFFCEIGETALHRAAKEGHTAAIDALIRHGADVHAKTRFGGTALYGAVQNGHTTAVEALVRHGASLSAGDGEHLISSVMGKGDVIKFTWLMEHGLKANFVDYNGNPFLNLAAAGKKPEHLQIAAYLLEHGADIHARSISDDTFGPRSGLTSLHVAAGSGNIEIMALLLKHGADINAKNKEKYQDGNFTPLAMAAYCGQEAAVNFLIEHGADVHLAKASSWASVGKHDGLAVRLKALEASRRTKEKASQDLLEAAKRGDNAEIDACVRDGADLNITDSDGTNALLFAAINGHNNTIRHLCERHHFNIHVKNPEGASILHFAAFRGQNDTIDFLATEYRLDMNMVNSAGRTVLLSAARGGHAKTIEHLINHYHSNINAQDNEGYTALHWAIEKDHHEAIIMLLKLGADMSLKNNKGLTPLMLAKQLGKNAVTSILEDQETLRLKQLLSSSMTLPTSSIAMSKPLPAPPKPLSQAPLERAKALYPYQATDANELSLVQGQILTVLEKLSNGWWRCQLGDKLGFAPGTYLETLPVSSSAASSATSIASSSTGSPSHSSRLTASSDEAGSLPLTDSKDFDQWVIPYSDLTLGKRLGKGSFGEVHLATYVHEPVAVKTLYVGETAKVLEDFKREVTVMMHLKSMYIVQLRAVTIKPYSMVMEYLPKGSLTQLLHNESEPMPWSQRHQLASDIAKGLAFLHHHHVSHRDLKSDNVLLTKDYQAKLSDFGLSKIKAAGSQQSSLTGGSVGTLCWMAPEVMDEDDKSPYRAASDVYSYAMIVWELMTRRQPYEGLSAKQLYVKVVIKAQRELIPEEAPPILQAITAQGWVQTPEERPSADDMVKQLAANPITPSAEPQAPASIGLASNTASLYGQRLGSALGISGAGFAPNTASLAPNTASLAPNTASLAPGSSPSASSTAGSSPSGAGFWNNLASLPPASRASVPPTMPRQ